MKSIHQLLIGTGMALGLLFCAGCHADATKQSVVAIFSGASPLTLPPDEKPDRPADPDQPALDPLPVSAFVFEDLDIKLDEQHLKLQAAVRSKRQAYETAQGEARTRLRNEILLPLMMAIMHYHEGTTDDLYETATLLETFFDWASLGLTAPIPLVSSGSKSVLGAASTALIGSRKALQANILAERTKYAVMLNMEAARLEHLNRFRANLTRDDAEYPLDVGLVDAYQMYMAGSVRAAVTQLTRQAEQNLQRVQGEEPE